jgi:uncharacterized protein (TIGR03083 family)
MKAVEPIYAIDLFPKINGRLIELLKSLSDEDWHKPTICALWDVKDIAAHLLDGTLRKISIIRDGCFGNKPDSINSYQALVDYLNGLNADWVKAARRLSPQVLIDLLEHNCRQEYELLKSLDPHREAMYSVAWAGEHSSENWFDIAREYTEKWHHQQQIRLAVTKPGITERELYYPVLDTFMRALPYTYRKVDAAEGVLLKFNIAGDAGGAWFLLRRDGHWRLLAQAEGATRSEVTIGEELAWRLFTKGIEKETARKEINITGDADLGGEIVNMLSVMA